MQVAAFAGRTATGRTDALEGEPALASEKGANHDWHDRGRDHPARAHFDREPAAATRSRDAPRQRRANHGTSEGRHTWGWIARPRSSPRQWPRRPIRTSAPSISAGVHRAWPLAVDKI